MFAPKNYSFGTLKELVQNTQQGLSDGWKNIADKAKKDVKVVNKMARKALATEDGGKLRDGYVTTVDLNAGYEMFKSFQDNWVLFHKDSVNNVNKAGQVDFQLNAFLNEWQKYDSYLEEFLGNLRIIPDVISNIEAIQKQVGDIAEQTKNVEDLLLEYEDACERFELEKCKVDMKIKLSQLVETKHAEYTLKKSFLVGNEEVDLVTKESVKKITAYSMTKNTEEIESVEKQKAYEDAFLDQMNQYIKYGEIEKPITGILESNTVAVEDININDSDLSTLREFLGPDEFNLVIQAQASQNKLSNKPNTLVTEISDNNSPDTSQINDINEENILKIKQEGTILDLGENENGTASFSNNVDEIIEMGVEKGDVFVSEEMSDISQYTGVDKVQVSQESPQETDVAPSEITDKILQETYEETFKSTLQETVSEDDDHEFFDASSNNIAE